MRTGTLVREVFGVSNVLYCNEPHSHVVLLGKDTYSKAKMWTINFE